MSHAHADAPTVVTITAADGRALVADYYAPPSGNGPAVLLLHQLYTTRASWNDLVPALQSNGYAVLAPDLRGYGTTGGPLDWRAAQDDTTLWLDWLRSQPGVRGDRIATVGSSMGANLAVIGCADDTARGGSCATSVAISPGRNYFGHTPLAPALPLVPNALFITSERDGYPALAARELAPEHPNVTVGWVAGNAHGIDLLDDTTTGIVLDWLGTTLR